METKDFENDSKSGEFPIKLLFDVTAGLPQKIKPCKENCSPQAPSRTPPPALLRADNGYSVKLHMFEKSPPVPRSGYSRGLERPMVGVNSGFPRLENGSR